MKVFNVIVTRGTFLFLRKKKKRKCPYDQRITIHYQDSGKQKPEQESSSVNFLSEQLSLRKFTSWQEKIMRYRYFPLIISRHGQDIAENFLLPLPPNPLLLHTSVLGAGKVSWNVLLSSKLIHNSSLSVCVKWITACFDMSSQMPGAESVMSLRWKSFERNRQGSWRNH